MAIAIDTREFELLLMWLSPEEPPSHDVADALSDVSEAILGLLALPHYLLSEQQRRVLIGTLVVWCQELLTLCPASMHDEIRAGVVNLCDLIVEALDVLPTDREWTIERRRRIFLGRLLIYVEEASLRLNDVDVANAVLKAVRVA